MTIEEFAKQVEALAKDLDLHYGTVNIDIWLQRRSLAHPGYFVRNFSIDFSR